MNPDDALLIFKLRYPVIHEHLKWRCDLAHHLAGVLACLFKLALVVSLRLHGILHSFLLTAGAHHRLLLLLRLHSFFATLRALRLYHAALFALVTVKADDLIGIATDNKPRANLRFLLIPPGLVLDDLDNLVADLGGVQVILPVSLRRHRDLRVEAEDFRQHGMAQRGEQVGNRAGDAPAVIRPAELRDAGIVGNPLLSPVIQDQLIPQAVQGDLRPVVLLDQSVGVARQL